MVYFGLTFSFSTLGLIQISLSNSGEPIRKFWYVTT